MNIYESWIVKSPIAHRGLFGDKVPENSLAAFKQAVKNKLPIEFDVTALADGTPVIFHDEKLARMTGRDGFISSLSLSDIADFKLQGTKEKIPTLAEALEVIDGKVPILIEIKNNGKVGPLEKAVWKELIKYDGEYAIESFNPYTLEWFKNNAPKIRRGQLSCFFRNKDITGVKRYALKRMLLNKNISEPNFIVYDGADMPNKYLKKYYGVIPVLAYTIRSEGEEMRLKGFCDNFLFDNYTPMVLRKDKTTKDEE